MTRPRAFPHPCLPVCCPALYPNKWDHGEVVISPVVCGGGCGISFIREVPREGAEAGCRFREGAEAAGVDRSAETKTS